jgi:hypothetical protein
MDGKRTSPEAVLLRCAGPALDFVQFPVNAQSDAADRHQFQFGSVRPVLGLPPIQNRQRHSPGMPDATTVNAIPL